MWWRKALWGTLSLLAALGVIICVCVFGMKACAKKTQTTDPHYAYINSREISLGAFETNSTTAPYRWIEASFGTAWFYENLGENRFELVTNYHVWDGIATEVQKAQTDHKHCLLGVCATPYTSTKDTSTHYTVEDYAYFEQDISITALHPIYHQTGTIPTPTGTLNAYMDMTALTIDFTPLLTSTSPSPAIQRLTDRLTALTAAYSTPGTKIITPATTPFTQGTTIYVAGYPWASWWGEQYDYTHFATVTSSLDNYQADATNQFDASSGINFATEQNQWFLPMSFNFPLGGGASGSMVTNSHDELLGIYWGGAQGPDYFSGAFATFEMISSPDPTYHTFFDYIDTQLNFYL